MVTLKISMKNDDEKSNDEKWDETLRIKENFINTWIREKTGIGPEPRLVSRNIETTAATCIYADDNSAGEEAYTVDELKNKTEKMLSSLFQHMKTSRLLVNADKTKVMLMATYQKRTKNDLRFHVDIEGERVEEVKSARLLGVEISNNFSWDIQVEETVKECAKRLNGLYKVGRQLSKEQRKRLAEGSIVSRLRYGLEVISSGSETVINRLSSMQSKAARYVLQKSRKEWSRTQGFEELDWLTIPQIAVESSLKMFFQVLWNKKPEKLLENILCEETKELVRYTEDELAKIPKVSRKSWRIRVMRYSTILPQYLFTLDPKTPLFKSSLKMWIKRVIPPEGDRIFKGKLLLMDDSEDWLIMEINEWRKRTEHSHREEEEFRELEEEWT